MNKWSKRLEIENNRCGQKNFPYVWMHGHKNGSGNAAKSREKGQALQGHQDKAMSTFLAEAYMTTHSKAVSCFPPT